MMDGLGKEFLAGAALPGYEHRRGIDGGHQGLLLEIGDGRAAADDAVEGEAGRAEVQQFLFVGPDLRFKHVHLPGEFHHLADILEHDQAEDGDNPAGILQRDAVHHDILAPDHLDLVDLGDTGPADDMHAGVLHHLGAVAADALLDINAEKIGIGPVQMGDGAVGIRDHGAARDIVKNQLKEIQLTFDRLYIDVVQPLLHTPPPSISSDWALVAVFASRQA